MIPIPFGWPSRSGRGGCVGPGWLPQAPRYSPYRNAGRYSYGWWWGARPRVGGCPLVAVSGSCCAACKEGKSCEVGGYATVGASQPNSEIAAHDASVSKLKSDAGAHQPKTGDATELGNWAALNHKLNGYLLRWGQWKTALASDWWWGDDDEQAFSALKDEYNKLRDEYLSYTSGTTSAPPAVVAPARLAEAEKKTLGGALKDLGEGIKKGASSFGTTLALVAVAGAGIYFFGPDIVRRLKR